MWEPFGKHCYEPGTTCGSCGPKNHFREDTPKSRERFAQIVQDAAPLTATKTSQRSWSLDCLIVRRVHIRTALRANPYVFERRTENTFAKVSASRTEYGPPCEHKRSEGKVRAEQKTFWTWKQRTFFTARRERKNSKATSEVEGRKHKWNLKQRNALRTPLQEKSFIESRPKLRWHSLTTWRNELFFFWRHELRTIRFSLPKQTSRLMLRSLHFWLEAFSDFVRFRFFQEFLFIRGTKHLVVVINPQKNNRSISACTLGFTKLTIPSHHGLHGVITYGTDQNRPQNKQWNAIRFFFAKEA